MRDGTAARKNLFPRGREGHLAGWCRDPGLYGSLSQPDGFPEAHAVYVVVVVVEKG